jgi:hypothetical protein
LNAHLHLVELGLVCIRKRFDHHVGDILHVHRKVASSFLIGVGVSGAFVSRLDAPFSPKKLVFQLRLVFSCKRN